MVSIRDAYDCERRGSRLVVKGYKESERRRSIDTLLEDLQASVAEFLEEQNIQLKEFKQTKNEPATYRAYAKGRWCDEQDLSVVIQAYEFVRTIYLTSEHIDYPVSEAFLPKEERWCGGATLSFYPPCKETERLAQGLKEHLGL